MNRLALATVDRLAANMRSLSQDGPSKTIAKERGEMTVSVRPWELQGRRRRRLAIVMGVVIAVCFLAVVYELS